MIKCDEIVKAISNHQKNFLDYDIDIKPTSLIYDKIYPYRMKPDFVGEPDVLITLGFGYKADNNNQLFQRKSVTFYVIVHKNLMSTNYGMRYDYIIDKIDEIFNQSDEFKSSKLQYVNMAEFPIDDNGDWMCASITYESLGF